MTLTDKVKTMAHCAIDCGIIESVNWSAEIIEAIENWDPRKPVDKETEYAGGRSRASDADDAMESPCESCGGCKHLDESTDEYAPRPTDRPDPKRMGGQA